MPETSAYQPGTPCWAELATPDLEVAKRFYAGLFGWTARTSPEPSAGGRTVFGLAGGGRVAAALPLMDEGRPPSWTGYVSVADTAATCETVLANGGHVHLDPVPVAGQGVLALCADPTGAVFGLWQPAALAGAGFADAPNTLPWNELACRDTGTARSFYKAVFEWTADTEPFAGSTYTTFSLDGRPVAGMVQMDETWPAELPPHWTLHFPVPDLDTACALLTRLGGTVRQPPSAAPSGRVSPVEDPHGTPFSLLHHPT